MAHRMEVAVCSGQVQTGSTLSLCGGRRGEFVGDQQGYKYREVDDDSEQRGGPFREGEGRPEATEDAHRRRGGRGRVQGPQLTASLDRHSGPGTRMTSG